jgi:uncharacterized protein YcaQ
MGELPYWRFFMERRKSEKRWADFAAENPKLLDEMRTRIRNQGPLRNRDLKGKEVKNYRGSKDTSVALYYLWLTGELMTHHRHGKERVYDFLENIAPVHLHYTANESDAIGFVARKEVSQLGIIDLRTFRTIWQRMKGSPVKLDEAGGIVSQWIEQEKLVQIQIEGYDQPSFVIGSDLPFLLGLQEGKVPRTWQPKNTMTNEEVVLLSPTLSSGIC